MRLNSTMIKRRVAAVIDEMPHHSSPVPSIGPFLNFIVTAALM